MKTMKEASSHIRLRDYLDNDNPWGREEGYAVHRRLNDAVRDLPVGTIIQISVANIKRTDASFPRESVAELARKYRGLLGFSIIDLHSENLIENWEAGATRLHQPIIVWNGDKWRFLGPQPSNGLQSVLAKVMASEYVVATEIAETEHINLSNASNKLKQLWQEGYVLRRPRAASTGGTEFEYYAIK